MEDDVFPSPAVAELMQQHFVESRQHTDAQNTLTADQFAKNKAAQAAIAGTRANPFFVAVDAKTGAKLDTFALSGTFTEWPQLWEDWLRAVLKQTGRK